jgi:DNA topoisomerase I
MHLVIVESPTKAKTIRKFLGADYKVIASMGHIRDLPESSDAVPESLKKTAWGKLGVDVQNNFEPLYVVPKGKTKIISELKQALKEAEDIYLATDEDREGESISWHLLQILKPKVPVHRMVFHEITKGAIEGALNHTREIDERLVRAQETRRVLDRLVGYLISPVLWKKIAFGLSAGRVQSAALKAIIDRERARMAFNKAGYFDVSANLKKDEAPFEATLVSIKGTRIATGKDFDETTGKVSEKAGNVLVLDEARAKEIAEQVKNATWSVTEVTEKPIARKPPAPFITSSLQQEANRKLGLSSKETMRVAQSLYEQGFITYMRTDSVALSEDAIKAVRGDIERRFGKEYLSEQPRRYTSTSKGAQEAHEAIRPSLSFTAPNDTGLDGAMRSVYEMIWMRTLACQMAESKQEQMTVTLDVLEHTFHATGMRILFPGFLRAYVEGAADTEEALEEKEHPLPPLRTGDHPACVEATAESHETKPPARFTEAGLIQYMEKVGIGRPSTYASIVSTLLDRKYVKKTGSALVPTFTGFAVTQLMERNFSHLVDVDFTSTMEESLDKIAEGKEEWLPYLHEFYFGEKGLDKKVREGEENIDPEEAKTIALPNLPETKIRIGKYGAYFEGRHPKNQTLAKASLPEDLAPSEMTADRLSEILDKAQQGPTSLGADPETGQQIYLKTGSYGPYIQLGEDPPEGSKEKVKRASVPKTLPLTELNLEKALGLLSLPRLLGSHPQSGKEIRAGLGRFGPYIVHDGEFRSLKAEDNVLTVSLERALELLAMPKGTRGGRAAAALRTIGEHPKDKKPITLHNGKYGMYIKHGVTNATLPKDQNPDALTLEQAVEILAARKAAKKTRRS